ncbi:hypothetical protein [Streptomyces sp. NPDC051554]|uniref:hypothetical protein n=1 Tax=Streptomyces sp. NPDC051554 TaxID=3365656 RepID=UPI0037AF8F7B
MIVRAVVHAGHGADLVGADRSTAGLHIQAYATSWGGWPIGDGGLMDRGAGKLLWFEVGGRCVTAYR